jgi:hypothetical protein
MGMFMVRAQVVNTGEVTVMESTVVSIVSDFNNTSTGTLLNDGDIYAYRNWNNDGVVDFLGTSGLTRFVGFGGTQAISGQNRSYLYDALFHNVTGSVPFQLSGIVSVANESNFSSGIVDNEDFGGLFVFEQDGFHSSTSDDSHVDGHVLKEGSTGFLYPIGDGGHFRFGAISAPELATDGFEGKYFLANSDALYPHENRQESIDLIDDTEYWTMERETGGSDVLVTLSWDVETTPSQIITAPLENNIHIVRWDGAQQLWVDEGGVVDVDSQTVTTAVSGYGVYTLARVSDATVLPCGLEIFNAVSADGNGENDFFLIDGLEGQSCATNVHVQIFNRWGVQVFETNDYGTLGNVFRGRSDGRLTINKDDKLPTGTYFYILDFNYRDISGQARLYKTTGYLYLTSE